MVVPSGCPPGSGGRPAFRGQITTFVLVGSFLAASSLASPAFAIPAPTTAPVVIAPVVTLKPSLAGPTSWRALNRAIAAIPTYRKGVAKWRVAGTGAHYYGATNLDTRQVYISRAVPSSRLYSVVAHEYAHALTVKNYAGNRRKLNAGLKKHFRSGPVMNREYAADCMARLMGARWTYYTKCTNKRWRAASATLLKGRRL